MTKPLIKFNTNIVSAETIKRYITNIEDFKFRDWTKIKVSKVKCTNNSK